MPTVGSVIAGATSAEQVKQNVAAGLWVPSGDDLDRCWRSPSLPSSCCDPVKGVPELVEHVPCACRTCALSLSKGSVHRQFASDRCRFLLPAPPMQQVLHTHRDQRGGHDQDQHRVDVVLDEGNVAQEVAGDGHPACPEHTTDCGVGDEMPKIHLADAGHQRDECADDRHEARQDERTVAVALEEDVGLVDVGLLEDLPASPERGLNSGGPILRPIAYPLTLPSTAAMVSTMQTNARLCGITPVAVSSPTVNSSESPGKIAKRPHSAKTMNATPQRAYGPKDLISSSGSIQDGSSIGKQRGGLESGHGAQRYRRRL